MPTRESELRPEPELAPEAAPPPIEPPQAKFSAEGELPAVSDKVAEPPATASEQAFDQKATADTSQLETGMHYPEHYREACLSAGQSQKWKAEYAYGHTTASQFTQPGEANPMSWSLKRGQSASDAIKAFVAGPTIADYRVIGVALELDELRDDMTDNRFDQLFGSRDGHDDAAIPGEHRLHISSAMYTTPFIAKMKEYVDKLDQGSDEDPLPPPAPELREDQPKQETAPEEIAVVADDLGKEPEREVV
ncbi:MAG TPA: hypothetical protein VGF94_17410 [Kofleriaceae bacterium]|jgi:hypothetical protein